MEDLVHWPDSWCRKLPAAVPRRNSGRLFPCTEELAKACRRLQEFVSGVAQPSQSRFERNTMYRIRTKNVLKLSSMKTIQNIFFCIGAIVSVRQPGTNSQALPKLDGVCGRTNRHKFVYTRYASGSP